MIAIRYVLAVLAVALGVAAIVYGEADDSPGLQGLGVLLIIGAVAFAVRAARGGRKRVRP
jgi:drug/metabolite transporter (DMT)-like permease